MIVYGTRPEAIKMAPIVAEARRSDVLDPVVAVTGQHRGLLDQVNELFGIHPDVDLDLFSHGQSLSSLTARSLEGVTAAIAELQPDGLVVQGDTSTSFAAALAAFYARVPVIHVEAGLRTGDLSQPFPEEANRVLISRLANLHLAPTWRTRHNLVSEGVAPADVAVTGNTVIDALTTTLAMPPELKTPGLQSVLDGRRRVLLVTAHRRESWGDGMRSINDAVHGLAQRSDVDIVLPAHPNPAVRKDLLAGLADVANVHIVEPLPYGDFVRVLGRCDLVLSDSGGVQEEAPSVGCPVLVLRNTTERVEALEAGTAKLVGTDSVRIQDEANLLLDNSRSYAAMAEQPNPFGDGFAATRSVAAIEALFCCGTRLPDFALDTAAVSRRAAC